MANQTHSEMSLLDEWFKVATKGLCEASISKIRIEIEAHFRDTVARELKRGFSRVDAERAAVTALGDAKIARKKLRRAHLTRHEFSILETKLPDGFWQRFGMVSFPILFICTAILFWIEQWETDSITLAALVLGIALTIVFVTMLCALYAPRLFGMSWRPSQQAFVNWNLLLEISKILGLCMLTAILNQNSAFQIAILVFCVLLAPTILFDRIRVFVKAARINPPTGGGAV